MNKRIRKMIQLQNSNRGLLWTEEDKEEFSQLIILECIRLCDQVDIVGADECMDKIKQYFGIEE